MRLFNENPVLTKKILMANFDQIVTDPRVDRRLVEHHLDSETPGDLLLGEYRVAATGGTTGEKGLAVFDNAAWLTAIGNTLRFQRIVGIDEATRSIAIFASSPVHISYRIGAEMRALRPPSPRLNVLMPIEAVVESLNTYLAGSRLDLSVVCARACKRTVSWALADQATANSNERGNSYIRGERDRRRRLEC